MRTVRSWVILMVSAGVLASHVFVNNVGEIVIPKKSVLLTLDEEFLQEIYHRYIQNIQVLCRRQLHLGNEKDGGYHVCEDFEVAPTSPCLLYSFGIRKDFSFDDGVAETFGCEVHSFDPFDGEKDHKRSKNVTFHKLGIGGRNEDIGKLNNTKLRTLGTIRSMLGHEERHISILKIDTEGAEWRSISEMVKSGTINDVKQLIVEFHVYLPQIHLASPSDYIAHLDLLRSLYEHGFRIYHFSMWVASGKYAYESKGGIKRTGCHEVHFLKVV